MDKILIKLFIPIMEKDYDMWIPLNSQISNVIELALKGIKEICGEEYSFVDQCKPALFNRKNGTQYRLNYTVKESGITNGTEIILI